MEDNQAWDRHGGVGSSSCPVKALKIGRLRRGEVMKRAKADAAANSPLVSAKRSLNPSKSQKHLYEQDEQRNVIFSLGSALQRKKKSRSSVAKTLASSCGEFGGRGER